MSKKKNPGSKKSGAKKKRAAGASATASMAGAETIDGSAEEVKPKKKSVGPFEFFQQVRSEGEKVTWTSRNETMVSTVMVLVMVVIMAIFFFIVDQILRFGVSNLIQLGSTAS